ncbi:MAG TPA: dUTP diphosphatase [Anaerolineae bacterium]
MFFYLDETARANQILPLTAPKPGDAGYDIRSNQNLEIHPGEQALVSTGLHVQIPDNTVGILKDRSSMASQGLRVSGGVIDASYRGEILVLLENRGHVPCTIKVNDRIVQMVVVPCYTEPTSSVNSLEDLGQTRRGESGFGSTGLQ